MTLRVSSGSIVLLAAILICGLAFVVPSFGPARSRNSRVSCKSNLRMIDIAKREWAEKTKAPVGSQVDAQAVLQLIGPSASVTCWRGGHYAFGVVGAVPRCSCGQTL